MSHRNTLDFTPLLKAAQQAAQQAVCPYSHYRVGAAILTAEGQIFTGCNIENASYGLTICAERVALFTALAAGNRAFTALALVAGTPGRVGVPCGACRQVLAEFCSAEFPILCASLDATESFTTTLGELLPLQFSPRDLHATGAS